MVRAAITGWGGYVPDNKVNNHFLSTIVDTSDEWIRTRTGIKNRFISTGENTSHLAIEASKQALANSNLKAKELDLIIVATVTPDSYTPATACLVQAALGASKATAFDVTAGCSGFVYGINIAKNFIENGNVQNALVIGAEVLSKVTNWQDRNTCVLFGDGAGAVILQASSSKGILASHCGTAGDVDGLLTIPAVPVQNPFVKGEVTNSHISMQGQKVFKFAVKAMKKSIEKVLDDANLTLKDIKYVIPHQANNRIIDFVAKKMKTDVSKFYKNIEHIGNTSAATIPIAFNEMISQGLLNKGDKVIMVGFGGGLTWGAVLVEL